MSENNKINAGHIGGNATNIPLSSGAGKAVDEKYMAIALEEAQIAAEKGEVPVGAVVVLDNQVIAKAHNLRETDKDPAAHAEFLAMEEAAKKLGRWRLSLNAETPKGK